MANIERWTIRVCPTCGERGGQWCAGHDEPHEATDTEPVEVVPADAYRGAVDRAMPEIVGVLEALHDQVADATLSWAEDRVRAILADALGAVHSS